MDRCKNCGNIPTIKAHLIPRVFCKQVQVGQSHASQIQSNGSFKPSQSGLFDKHILCATCDGKLGRLENHVARMFQVVRAHGSNKFGAFRLGDNVDCVKLIRFCAGILYKYSITMPERGQIQLGAYQKICQEAAFGDGPIPEGIDAFTWRPIRFMNDRGVFAYRAPCLDVTHGVNLFRFMLGGLLIFVKLDNRPVPDAVLHPFMLRNASSFRYLVVPAQQIEEYQIPLQLIQQNETLSKYLDKIAFEQPD